MSVCSDLTEIWHTDRNFSSRQAKLQEPTPLTFITLTCTFRLLQCLCIIFKLCYSDLVSWRYSAHEKWKTLHVCVLLQARELRQKALLYRRRAWGTNFSRDHLSQLVSENNALWEPTDTTDSTTPRTTLDLCQDPDSHSTSHVEALDLARWETWQVKRESCKNFSEPVSKCCCCCCCFQSLQQLQ